VLAALDDIAEAMPFPILGVDSSTTERSSSTSTCSNGAASARSPLPGRGRPTRNGCHVEQKNWATVRTTVGYHRYDTASEVLLLNTIWSLQTLSSSNDGSDRRLRRVHGDELVF